MNLGRVDRDALHAVHPRLELEHLEDAPAAPADVGDGLGDAPHAPLHRVLGILHDGDLEAEMPRVLCVEVENLLGKYRSLAAAGAGNDFQDGVACIVGLSRKEIRHDVFGDLRDLGIQCLQVVFNCLGEVSVFLETKRRVVA